MGGRGEEGNQSLLKLIDSTFKSTSERNFFISCKKFLSRASRDLFYNGLKKVGWCSGEWLKQYLSLCLSNVN